MTPVIDRETAERLRAVLSEIQEECLALPSIVRREREALVIFISERGFRLVDELDGVIR